METTIAKYITGTLSAHKIKRFFTIPGSSCIGLNRALSDNGILPVLSRSEESAAHAAHGYAAATESFGCAVVSRGPAATNTITGLVTASEGYPVLVIIGDNASDVRQKNIATQDLPLEKIFNGVCDYATINNPSCAEEAISYILHRLTNLKKSCVLIVPSDMWEKEIHVNVSEKPPQEKTRANNIAHLSSAVQKLPKTSKNVLLIGSNVLNDPSLRSIAERLINKYRVPFVVSTRGLGYPHPQRIGWVGIMASPDANSLLYESEHIVILGESLETATTGNVSHLKESRKITCISLTPEGQPGFTPDYSIHIKRDEFEAFLDLLLKQIKFIDKEPSGKSPNQPKPEAILENILRQLPSRYTVCLDSGQNFFWGAHALIKANKHRVIYSYTQATMGFGLPALVGIGSVDPHVLLICGDGGFLMAIEELSTIHSAGFKGKIIILNNNMLGMIYQTQKIKKMPRLAVDVEIHDLEKVVEGFGWSYISISNLNDVAIKQFLKSTNNCVLDIQIGQNENVYPRGSTNERLPTE